MNRRVKNYESRTTNYEIPLHRNRSHPFFRNTLKVLCFVAVLQLGAALVLMAPHFIKMMPELFSHKNTNISEVPSELSLPKKNIPLSSHTEANKPPLTQSTLLSENNLQPGASLSIIDIHHTHGSLGEQALKIAIKSQTQEPISIPDVKVQVYFYDQQGEEVIPSKAPVTSRWLHSPVEWKNGEPEILEVIYQPESVSPELYYVGYIVAVYYKGELQSYRADPIKLVNQFPIKVFIGPSEI